MIHIKKFSLMIIAFTMVLLIIFIFSNLTTIKIITPTEKIERFTTNDIVAKKDYKKEIAKIEKMLYFKTKTSSSSRDLYTYIVIESTDGHKEVIIHSDYQMIHLYDEKVIEMYKIPYLTYVYSKSVFWD